MKHLRRLYHRLRAENLHYSAELAQLNLDTETKAEQARINNLRARAEFHQVVADTLGQKPTPTT